MLAQMREAHLRRYYAYINILLTHKFSLRRGVCAPDSVSDSFSGFINISPSASPLPQRYRAASRAPTNMFKPLCRHKHLCGHASPVFQGKNEYRAPGDVGLVHCTWVTIMRWKRLPSDNCHQCSWGHAH